MIIKKKKSQIDSNPTRECKHCGHKLGPADIQRMSKKRLPERFGLMWGGIEYPYVQVCKIHCPNLACGKSYSHKYKGSNWKYK